MDNENTPVSSGATEIFRMPSADATVPDIIAVSKPVQPTLTIVKGPQVGETFELNAAIITVGRGPNNSVFLNDMTVSRHHANLDLTNVAAGYATVKDLGSLNGTWVDGAIVNEATLKDGSTIQIGTFRMVFHTNGRKARIATEL
ncbi:FHA domain-containing protein [Paratractidigestivibacter sp.]|uniref:FHA domain-containing protein n=1 Tax=Paratractidigestivibacter sp. TaxID=2847316 RepID=UPI002ABE8E4A|nr:FHA domain-containing protein [Paratractidigestivibacter sp.]